MKDVQGMHLSDDGTHVVVIWDWELESAQLQSTTQSDSDNEQSDHASESDDVPECDQDVREECIHTVTFKCMGSTREKPYQNVLEKARDKLQEGFTVDVRLTPEPHNMFDSDAVAFECSLDGQWKNIWLCGT